MEEWIARQEKKKKEKTWRNPIQCNTEWNIHISLVDDGWSSGRQRGQLVWYALAESRLSAKHVCVCAVSMPFFCRAFCYAFLLLLLFAVFLSKPIIYYRLLPGHSSAAASGCFAYFHTRILLYVCVCVCNNTVQCTRKPFKILFCRFFNRMEMNGGWCAFCCARLSRLFLSLSLMCPSLSRSFARYTRLCVWVCLILSLSLLPAVRRSLCAHSKWTTFRTCSLPPFATSWRTPSPTDNGADNSDSDYIAFGLPRRRRKNLKQHIIYMQTCIYTLTIYTLLVVEPTRARPSHTLDQKSASGPMCITRARLPCVFFTAYSGPC